jgi:hypothetical protein
LYTGSHGRAVLFGNLLLLKRFKVLFKILAISVFFCPRCNAHDIEGYMEVYWKSPDLLVVVDAGQFNGWQQLHDSYNNGYPDRSAMGFIQPKRIQSSY